MLVNHADFQVLMLLGKSYFHVCKFKQSLFALNLAISKVKHKSPLMESTLAEALLWTIYVQTFYLVNKFRVLRNYWIAKNETPKSRSSRMTYIEIDDIGKPHTDTFDSTEIAVSQEIFDLYKDLKANVDEFV